MNKLIQTASLIAVLALWASVSCAYQRGTIEQIEITVTDRERIVDRSREGSSSRYLVFTDAGVFENTDALWHLKFSSSDLQGRLKPGRRFRVTVYGWRIPLISFYPNIVRIEKLLDASGDRPAAASRRGPAVRHLHLCVAVAAFDHVDPRPILDHQQPSDAASVTAGGAEAHVSLAVLHQVVSDLVDVLALGDLDSDKSLQIVLTLPQLSAQFVALGDDVGKLHPKLQRAFSNRQQLLLQRDNSLRGEVLAVQQLQRDVGKAQQAPHAAGVVHGGSPSQVDQLGSFDRSGAESPRPHGERGTEESPSGKTTILLAGECGCASGAAS